MEKSRFNAQFVVKDQECQGCVAAVFGELLTAWRNLCRVKGLLASFLKLFLLLTAGTK